MSFANKCQPNLQEVHSKPLCHWSWQRLHVCCVKPTVESHLAHRESPKAVKVSADLKQIAVRCLAFAECGNSVAQQGLMAQETTSRTGHGHSGSRRKEGMDWW